VDYFFDQQFLIERFIEAKIDAQLALREWKEKEKRGAFATGAEMRGTDNQPRVSVPGWKLGGHAPPTIRGFCSLTLAAEHAISIRPQAILAGVASSTVVRGVYFPLAGPMEDRS
jgi:hypothetical protein